MTSRLSPPAADEIAVHRALADPSRARIFETLAAAPAGMDADAIAAEMGLHVSTVRFHLKALADAGLVTSRPRRSGSRGRPRIVYRRTGRAAAGGDERARRELAAVLARSLAESPDGPDLARRAGRARAARRPEPRRLPPAEARRRLIAELEAQGFRPQERPGGLIALRGCPFGTLAATDGAVVCAAHRGMLEGMLEAMGGGVRVAALNPFATPGECLLRLEPAPDRDPDPAP